MGLARIGDEEAPRPVPLEPAEEFRYPTSFREVERAEWKERVLTKHLPIFLIFVLVVYLVHRRQYTVAPLALLASELGRQLAVMLFGGGRAVPERLGLGKKTLRFGGAGDNQSVIPLTAVCGVFRVRSRETLEEAAGVASAGAEEAAGVASAGAEEAAVVTYSDGAPEVQHLWILSSRIGFARLCSAIGQAVRERGQGEAATQSQYKLGRPELAWGVMWCLPFLGLAYACFTYPQAFWGGVVLCGLAAALVVLVVWEVWLRPSRIGSVGGTVTVRLLLGRGFTAAGTDLEPVWTVRGAVFQCGQGQLLIPWSNRHAPAIISRLLAMIPGHL